MLGKMRQLKSAVNAAMQIPLGNIVCETTFANVPWPPSSSGLSVLELSDDDDEPAQHVSHPYLKQGLIQPHTQHSVEG